MEPVGLMAHSQGQCNNSYPRPRHRWEGNIRIDLKEIVVNSKNWIDSVQDRDYWRALVNKTLNLRIP
jgi:hypothetical protein